MARPSSAPITLLGQAMQARRGVESGRDVALSIGVDPAVFYRLETGRRGPSAQTARSLARWLGWTTDQVLDAAEQQLQGSKLGAALAAHQLDTGTEDLTARLGVSAGSLALIEQGRATPRPDVAEKIAVVLGWSVEEVLEAAEQEAGPASSSAP